MNGKTYPPKWKMKHFKHKQKYSKVIEPMVPEEEDEESEMLKMMEYKMLKTKQDVKKLIVRLQAVTEK